MTAQAFCDKALDSFRSYWAWILLGSLVLRIIYLRNFHPLHNVPGPFLASITRLWLVAAFLSERQHWIYSELHKKYGPIVRISPNGVIINNHEHFREYFDWDKSEWWLVFRGHPEDLSHGNELDIELHRLKKRRIMGGYTMSQVLKNEKSMDVHVMDLLKQLLKRTNSVFDLAPWTQFATFDIAMEMAVSNPLGFVKAGTDVQGLIASLHSLLAGAGIAATYPWIAKLVYHPWLFPIIGPKPTDKSGPGLMHGLAYEQVRRRNKENYNHEDILQWIIDHEDKEGRHLTQSELEQEALAPVLAGSDSTSSCLRSIILYVSTNPAVLNKLLSEINDADSKGLLPIPPKFDEIKRHIPYIEGVFKEVLRVLPIVGSPLFRAVPKGGVHVEGLYLPEGTDVGISQWAVSRNPTIFGPDAELFRPERWTESLDTEARRLRDSGDIFFGSGTMLCTGRNIAILEIYKIATQFFRTFQVDIINPASPWKERDALAIIHRDFFVNLMERKDRSATWTRET